MKRFSFVMLILILFAFPSAALADIAPPQNPPGSNLNPGAAVTQVRMAAETVLIDVQKDAAPDGSSRAHATAEFTMRNLGNAPENLAVRFPIAANSGWPSDRYPEYPEITDIAIRVDGKQVVFRRASYAAMYGSGDARYDVVPWAEFDVTFPVGQDVAIQVAYDLKGTGYEIEPFTSFSYTLETGAGWNGTIGSADVILRLPYEASVQNVFLSGEDQSTPGGTLQGNEVRWHFEDFEPGLDGPVQNMEFRLVKPILWQAVLIERANVSKDANDGEAWGRLARAYKDVLFWSKGFERADPGGEELYPLSVEAYEKCLSLVPDDAQWHAGFADLLASHSPFSQDPAEVRRILEEIHTALQLAPNDPKVLEIAGRIDSFAVFPEGILQTENGYDFPWLTAMAPFIDPEAVSGVYQSEMLALSDGQRVQLTLTLSPDYTAELETKYGNGDAPMISIGRWFDNRDRSLTIAVFNFPADPHDGMSFTVKNNLLQASSNPSIYGGLSINKLIELKRLINATATSAPQLTNTPQPTNTAQPTNAPQPTAVLDAPTSSPPSLLWLAAALGLLAGVIWFARRRRP